MKVCIGIDVGGTNTDAVVLHNDKVVAKCKQPTTLDVTAGVQHALSTVLAQLAQHFGDKTVVVSRVNIGTTHFLNAVLQRKGLARVAVIRLCGPASRAVPPFCDLPDDLHDVVYGGCYFVDGGYEFNGKEIKSVRKKEIIHVITQLKRSGTQHVVVSGVFSSLCNSQETAVGEILKAEYPEASFTLSHQVADMGLLERENSSILNESLKPLSAKSVVAFTKATRNSGLKCPVFFTQNDGTMISAEKSTEFPVLTFSSGPTNSMRGAAFLSGNTDAIVIDIGGTSTDVGVLVHGFPREASTRVKCGGVTTNFRMPDILSIALGGGSIVRRNDKKLTIGPDSIGSELVTRSLVYGGSTLTTTDISVSGDLGKIGDSSKVANLDKSLVEDTLALIHEMIEDTIDRIKVKAENQSVILVGGGSVLIDAREPLQGASVVLKPEHFEVANAVGAALSQVSGTVDQVLDLADKTREEALREAEAMARAKAIENGAQPETAVIVEKSDKQLNNLKGNKMRVQVKAMGNFILDDAAIHEEIPTTTILKASACNYPSTAAYLPGISPEEHINIQELEIKPETKSIPVEKSLPCVESSTGEWLVNEFDVECIATGAAILGCGGGGSPHLGRLRAHMALQQGKKIRVIHPESVPDKGLILGVGIMGAPSVLIEKLVGGDESRFAVEFVQKVLVSNLKEEDLGKSSHGVQYVKHLQEEPNKNPEEKRIVCIMSIEIGGTNSTEPLIIGAELGLPVVDCDGMGRAFPELQMFTPFIYGSNLCPCALVGSSGSSEIVTYAKTAKDLENHLRDVIVTRMGCIAGIAMAPLTAQELARTTVKFSMSRAWHLGHAVKIAQKEKRCPVKAILEVQNGKLLATGKVIAVERKTEGGFNKGSVKVNGVGDFSGSLFIVSFQNENLLVEKNLCNEKRELIASTPDLIALIETETGEAILTEDVRYGLRVSVIVLPCSSLLSQEQGLNVVGPQAFGYKDYVYKPTGVYKPCDPIPVAAFSKEFK